MIIVINYGLGNLRSIEKALNKLGADFKISSNINEIKSASHLILPGVGAFKEGMKNLRGLGLIDVIREEVLNKKKPILGICLGMQLLFDSSEEGGENEGLGLVRGKVKRFDFEKTEHKVPHMGWNSVFGEDLEKFSVFDELGQETNFYFVHSYHANSDEGMVKLLTNHGYDFISAFQKDNIIGTQFHPEKSQTAGLKLLKNFISKC